MGRHHKRRSSSSGEFLILQSQPGPTPPSKDDIPILEDFLTKAAKEGDIIDGMKELSRLIGNHVNTYISMSSIPRPHGVDAVTVKGNVEEALSVCFNNDSQLRITELSGFLVDARTRRSSVRFLIAWILLPRISYHADPKHTLLPSELISFMNQIPPPAVDWQSK